MLMMMDIDPDPLTHKTIDELKKIYKLLIGIHSKQAPKPPELSKPQE